MQQSVPCLDEVALTTSPRGNALFQRLADPRQRGGRGRLSRALGLHCPCCGQSIVAAVAGGSTAEALTAMLRTAGCCRHEAPAPVTA